jgi:hypothetical protein
VNVSGANVKNKVAVNRADDKTASFETNKAAGGNSRPFVIYVQTGG